jgi:dihydrofolate synthase/folylpolyglutamate synthase
LSSWWAGTTRFGIRPGLDRTRFLMERLGHPERAVPVVHIAGTNGKGSTAALIDAALRAAGLSTGLYTSPDLGDVRERVMVGGRMLAAQDWHRLAARVEAAAGGAPEPPTTFEALTALALLAFAEAPVDVAILEVGLGGRMDATNVVPAPAMTVLTPIALDHQEVLGPDVFTIAADKAGIIKAGARVVSAPQAPPAAMRVRERVRQQDALLRWARGRLLWSDASGVTVEADGRTLRTRLLGRHQATNLLTAWTALIWLGEEWALDPDAMAAGLERAVWPARLEVMAGRPLVLIDGAHNLHGVHALRRALEEPHLARPWHLVWGTFQDKPSALMLRHLLPRVETVVLSRPSGPRGQDPSSIREAVRIPARKDPLVEPNLPRALRAACDRAGEDGAVLVAGSLAMAGEARRWWVRSAGAGEVPVQS